MCLSFEFLDFKIECGELTICRSLTFLHSPALSDVIEDFDYIFVHFVSTGPSFQVLFAISICVSFLPLKYYRKGTFCELLLISASYGCPMVILKRLFFQMVSRSGAPPQVLTPSFVFQPNDSNRRKIPHERFKTSRHENNSIVI